MFIVYTRRRKAEKIETVNLTREELEEIGADEWVNTPNINKEEHIVIEREKPFDFPIYDRGSVREATKEEKIELGYAYELDDGEKVEDGKLVTVEQPADLYRPFWDRELEEWTEGASVDAIYDARELKVLEIMDLSEKIERLEKAAKISPILASPKTIERRKKDMAKLEQEVIELTALIEKLEK